MTKVLTVDDLEIEFEKQNADHTCKWCIYIRLRKKDKEQTIMMIRTNNKPHTRFTAHLGNIVNQSKEALKDVLANSMNDVEDLQEIENSINEKD